MTLPNKLTLSRYVLTPVFAVFFCLIRLAGSHAVRISAALACLLIYAYMEITDFIDGRIARKRGLVTDLGKVFDPFSDSVMHLTFFALFMRFDLISFVAFYVIMFRELTIVFLRLLLVKAGTVLPANFFGKFKTAFYAALSFIVIAYVSASAFEPSISPEFERAAVMIFRILSYCAAFFSLLSLIVYFGGIIRSKALSSLTK